MKTIKMGLAALLMGMCIAACGNSNSESTNADTSIIVADPGVPASDTDHMNNDGTDNAAGSAVNGEANGINPDSTNTGNTDNMRK